MSTCQYSKLNLFDNLSFRQEKISIRTYIIVCLFFGGKMEDEIYEKIKNELIKSIIEKKVDNYFTYKNELTHYYNVGQMIVEAQGGEKKAKYGDSLIQKFSRKLTSELGRGYSIQSLKKMRRFYLYFQKRPTMLVQSISWSHYEILLSLKNDDEINYYISQINKYLLSIRLLKQKIKNEEYQRLNNKTKYKLINNDDTKISDLIKNPIIINTYNNNKEYVSETILKSFILHDMDNFLDQLGYGFCYIKSEYKIKIGNTFNYIDILLFNYIFNSFVVVELKVVETQKDHLGQIMIYMNYIDKHIKNTNHNKTIGIIVCKKDNKYLIEYSSDDRIRITTYKLI